ncbi:hypothetical protein [uncultured Sneathiella sp.]|jgi:hypothetical protein|uniref:hypothetical protein n=1 Tax=uncultured Sneathiella sp. TaxID=879315 RepID=UPI0030DA096C|tara:strand:- start:2000 stop:2956 length:957 start_codon:yes stop_codon:yes gene_type:complete
MTLEEILVLFVVTIADIPTIITVVVIFCFRNLLISLAVPVVVTILFTLIQNGHYDTEQLTIIRLAGQLLVAAATMRAVVIWMSPTDWFEKRVRFLLYSIAGIKEASWIWKVRRNSFLEEFRGLWKPIFYGSGGIGIIIGLSVFLFILIFKDTDEQWNVYFLGVGSALAIFVGIFGGISSMFFVFLEVPIVVAEEVGCFIYSIYKALVNGGANKLKNRATAGITAIKDDSTSFAVWAKKGFEDETSRTHKQNDGIDFVEYKKRYFEEVKRQDPDSVVEGMHWLEFADEEGTKRAYGDGVDPKKLAEIVLSSTKIKDING